MEIVLLRKKFASSLFSLYYFGSREVSFIIVCTVVVVKPICMSEKPNVLLKMFSVFPGRGCKCSFRS